MFNNVEQSSKKTFSFYEQKNIRDKIKSDLTAYDYIQIYKIIKDNNVQHTTRQKGVYISMADIPYDILMQIKNFIDNINKKDEVTFYDKASNRISKLYDCNTEIKGINKDLLVNGSYSDTDSDTESESESESESDEVVEVVEDVEDVEDE